MTELEEIHARFEELNEILRVNPDMEHREAMLIIDAMRVCVDEKNALKEAEYIARENDRQRRILEEEIVQALVEFFGEEISDEDMEALTEKLLDVYATTGDGYEK